MIVRLDTVPYSLLWSTLLTLHYTGFGCSFQRFVRSVCVSGLGLVWFVVCWGFFELSVCCEVDVHFILSHAQYFLEVMGQRIVKQSNVYICNA